METSIIYGKDLLMIASFLGVGQIYRVRLRGASDILPKYFYTISLLGREDSQMTKAHGEDRGSQSFRGRFRSYVRHSLRSTTLQRERKSSWGFVFALGSAYLATHKMRMVQPLRANIDVDRDNARNQVS